jgi:two-component system, OmpR family, sensor histidine kinase RstB
VFKLVLRFFIGCIVITLLAAPLILYIQNKVNEADNLGNIKLITQGEFALLDELLARYPQQQWQAVINTLQTKKSGAVTIMSLEQLALPMPLMAQLKQNQLVFYQSDYPYVPTTAYKRVANTDYVYQQIIEFTDIDWAHRFFDLSYSMIVKLLRDAPQQQWSKLFTKLSIQYGYPITLHELSKLNLESQKIQDLRNKQWAVDLPDKKDDTLQTIYAPLLDGREVLQFGPIQLPFSDTYKTYILFVSAFILLELIVFLFAILFARSLDKLKILANNYGHGNFDVQIGLRKTSTLFPLFANLKKMGERIKQLINSHRDLTNSVSHELRTPISRLRFSLEFLKTAKNKAETDKRIVAMEEDVTELEELVAEILTYAQLDRLDPVLELTSISLLHVVNTVIDKFKKNNSSKQLLIAVPYDSNHIMVNANAKYLQRALQNLLQNAERFANSKIKLGVVITNAASCQLIIEDDGFGIAMEDRETIFQPFRRLSQQQQGQLPGYGLGLAITKKILAQHGWRIVVEDSALGGAKMVITINK